MSGTFMRSLFFSDIEGSTALLQRIGSRYTDMLIRHQQIVREACTEAGGAEQSTEGDSFFVTFDSATAAVAAAVRVQLRHQQERWFPDARIQVRIGIHVGEVSETAAGLVGLAIHHGARISASAHGGQIVVSEVVHAMCDNLPDGIGLRSLSAHRLRDVGTVELFQVTHPELVDQFPPLRARGGVPKHLPAPATSLVGRRIEAEVVADLLDRYRLVTLTGAGGCGKTRLAVHVAAQAADRFVDGVWFVDLAAVVDGDLVLSTVRDALGVRDAQEEPLDVFIERYMLIVLDNCEQVVAGVASAVARLLAASPGIAILATSREPLAVAGESVYRVPSLELPSRVANAEAVMASEAGRLFVDRATRARVDYEIAEDDASAIAEICRRVDGIPLAIELAAAFVRAMRPAEIAHLLHDRSHLMSGAFRAAVPRQQTLKATIDWSYNLLSAVDKRTLAVLSVFPGTFDLPSVQRVLGGEIDEYDGAFESLVSLHDKSLLNSLSNATTRFHLPETIRQYTAELLSPGARLEVESRHAHHYCDRIENLGRSDDSGSIAALFDACEAEIDNLASAITWFSEHDPALGLKLFNWICRAANLTGRLDIAASLSGTATQNSMDELSDDTATAWAHLALMSCVGLVDVDVRNAIGEAQRHVVSVGDLRVQAEVQAAIEYVSSLVDGTQIDESTVRRITTLSDESGWAMARIACRQILAQSTPHVLGLSLLTEAAAIAKEAGEPELEQAMLLDVAVQLGELGLSEQALAMARTNLVNLRDLAHRGRVDVEILAFVALLEGEHGDLATALNLAEDLAASVAARPHPRRDEGAAAAVVARLKLLAGDVKGAELTAREALSLLAADSTIVYISGLAGITLALALTQLGRASEAACLLPSYAPTPGSARSGRLLEAASQVAVALDRAETAADLLSTATHARLSNGRPVVPADLESLDRLRKQLAGIAAKVLEPDEAIRAIRSLVD